MNFKAIFIKTFIWLVLAFIGTSLVGLSGTYLYLSPKLPSVESLRDVRLQTPLRIYTSDDKLIGEFGSKRRTPVTFDEIPQNYINALLAAEDSQFFSHHGVSFKGIMRAVIELVTTGEKGSGGSTITMQVARNYFLTPTKAFIRKFNEILLALKIEQELTKKEIFELYVNVTFLGKHAYGINAAAEVYYGNTLSNLTLAQLAMIAGLPQGPSTQNPIINPVRALERRNWILGRMLKLKLISDEEYDAAKNEPVTASYHNAALDLDAPYIAELARQKAVELVGNSVYSEGYSVYTTVDSSLQKAAQEALVKGLLEYDQRHGYRGPENTLDAKELIITTGTDKGISVDYSRWLTQLKDIDTYAKLEPAVVTQTEDRRIHVLMSDNQIYTLEWDQGLSEIRPYLTENSRAAPITLAGDAFKVGDIVRVKRTGNSVHITQVPQIQGAHVALAPHNGAIMALVGGFDFKQSNFIRATQAKRQPGSNFKPFVYTVALENGMNAASIINDAPLVLDDNALESVWRPENDGGKFSGPTRLRVALYRSLNLVSIRILRQIGIATVIEGLDKFGFDTSQLPRNLSLALGSHAVTPFDMVKGWAVLANGGYQVEPYLIEFVTDIEGERIYSAMPPTVCRDCDTPEQNGFNEGVEDNSEDTIVGTDLTDELPLTSLATEQEPATETAIADAPRDHQLILSQGNTETLEEALPPPISYPRATKVLDDRVAYMIDSILKDVITRGTGYRAKVLKRNDLAGKTGTTNGPKDAWFSGYSSHLVATTWVGFDQNTLLGKGEYGGSAALPIWIDFMREANKGKPEIARPQPQGLVTIKIDPKSGLRAKIDSASAVFEIFRSENVPAINIDEGPSNQVLPFEESVTEELF